MQKDYSEALASLRATKREMISKIQDFTHAANKATESLNKFKNALEDIETDIWTTEHSVWHIEHPENDVPKEIWNDDNFADQSWHNDSCSSFVINSLQVANHNYIKLWVEYPEVEQRSPMSENRYSMAYYDDDELITDLHLVENVTLEGIFAAIKTMEKEGFDNFVNHNTISIMQDFNKKLTESKG